MARSTGAPGQWRSRGTPCSAAHREEVGLSRSDVTGRGRKNPRRCGPPQPRRPRDPPWQPPPAQPSALPRSPNGANRAAKSSSVRKRWACVMVSGLRLWSTVGYPCVPPRESRMKSSLGCIPDRSCLWSGMITGLRRPGASWPRRLIGLLLLALAVAATPNVGLEMLGRPHCEQHGMTAAAGGGHATAEHATIRHIGAERAPPTGGSPAWNAARSHECPHCPASKCAQIWACGGTTTTALLPRGVAVAELATHRVPLDRAREYAFSAASPPDTPPPQPIS